MTHKKRGAKKDIDELIRALRKIKRFKVESFDEYYEITDEVGNFVQIHKTPSSSRTVRNVRQRLRRDLGYLPLSKKEARSRRKKGKK